MDACGLPGEGWETSAPGQVSIISLIKVTELTNNHGGNSEPVLGIGDLASSTTKFGVDLHGNVGAVLRLGLLDMHNVETL
jgi:hypothetical protein